MNKSIRNILTDLEHVHENLLSLSDDIWLSIDHNDQEALNEGVAFKKRYNEKMIAFGKLASAISSLVQEYTNIQIEEHQVEPWTSPRESRDRFIKDMDKLQPHSLDESFTYKRPYGFVLEDQGYKEIVTWRRVYELFLKQLAAKSPDTFTALCENPDYHSNRGNPTFSQDPLKLRSAMPVTDGIHAESNLSANSIRDLMKRLLETFGIPETEVKIYLREDRDAEE
ncbi:MAG: hypothetical protein AMXMBFR75_15250 [Candidatus Hinthialibacteria bacterium]|nr:hypothetical protein [bacterium]MBV6482295.1 hypothetical protein [bacterium]MCE7907543.1 hypothetical protein [Candidatus Omnitrophica bacterium COP1]